MKVEYPNLNKKLWVLYEQTELNKFIMPVSSLDENAYLKIKFTWSNFFVQKRETSRPRASSNPKFTIKLTLFDERSLIQN